MSVNRNRLGRQIMYLSGPCCPACAGKIEEQVRLIDGVTAAIFDFVSRKITIEVADKTSMSGVTKEVSRIIRDIEPGARVSSGEKEAKAPLRIPLRRGLQGLGMALFIFGMAAHAGGASWFTYPLSFGIFLAAYLLTGWDVLFSAVKNLGRGRIFDENSLMSAATIGAFAIGQYPEGAAVMLFYQAGEFFQDLAVRRSRSSISALMDIRPDFANLKTAGGLRRVNPEEVKPGDRIVVKPGEKVPLDGIVVEGSSALDTSALTGEALPRDAAPGDEILSGSINKSGLLTIEVSRGFGESTVSKILELVENAGSRKSPIENFITRFARYYTPLVVFSALALAVIPPLFVPGASWAQWINRGLVFLVVSCPCALVISIPLSFFGGIGAASKRGILVKGSNYLEALTRVETVVFDKTGTLTRGIFRVSRILPGPAWAAALPAGTRPEDELLRMAARAERHSNHPIALSIQEAWSSLKAAGTAPEASAEEIAGGEEIAGEGIRVHIGGRMVLAGSAKFLAREGIGFEEPDLPGTAVHLAVEGAYAGSLIITDELKQDSAAAVEELRELGIQDISILTGDSRLTGNAIGRELGVDRVYAELLPQEKVAVLEKLEQEKSAGGKLVFVGDGINDAPVLARSDVGIAMGGLGSDAAIEAADVVLMTDEPSKVAEAVRIARRTQIIVWQNIIFALGVKAAILVLGVLGIATMWAAVFGDVGVTLIAVLNAMRSLWSSGTRAA
ncbi:MAG: heavy metal translocating P-type ATPase [Treponema sp.]|nr:heavy metal translocating P-type ATPase [Treponema sp.]